MAKKTKIFRLAKELNIAADAVIDFLKDSGFAVQDFRTTVDEDMYTAVMERFSAEKTVAEQKSRKKMAAQGLLSEEDNVETEVDKKKDEAERPAILDALESLQEQAKIGKVKPKAEVEKEESKTVEKEKVRKPKVAKTEDEEAPATGLPKGVIRTISDTEVDARGALIEKPEAVKEKTSKPAKGKKADKVEIEDKADVVDVPVKEKKKDKEPSEIDERETEASKRKLSKKGLGLAERIKEEQKGISKKAPAAPGLKDTEDDQGKKGKKRKKVKKKRVDAKEVDASIKETLAKMDASSKTKKYKRKAQEVGTEEEETGILRIGEFASVAEFASMMEIETNEVIKKCMELGLFVSINQRLDMDTITMVADEFGFEVEEIKDFDEEGIELEEISEEGMEPRPAVVTIMGHVDHGKTSLLDYIRNENVVAGEKGGITQHIGAYEVDVDGKNITFLDTPGHEAFTAMRARGAQATDIVVLIVAADDNVMPQTLEALNHAQAADVPIIIAINKIDKPQANPDNIKQQLADHNVLVESWGGKYQSVDISAKAGTGIKDLLETILFQAELLELKAHPGIKPRGVVVEARLEKGRGVTATLLVQQGTMRVGDFFVCGQHFGRVRAMFNERGKKVKEAPPSTPVQIQGFSGMPQAGDTLNGMESEKEAKRISTKRTQLKRERSHRTVKIKSLYDFSEQIKKGEIQELNVILKGDTDGSVEAIEDSFLKIKSDEVEVKIIHKSIGAITETDVLLASASEAIIIGFQVRPNLNARAIAEKEDVDIRLYDVIYNAIEDVKAALEGMLSPEISEKLLGTIEVRETFRIPKGTIAGCYVVSGKVTRNDKLRLVRDGVVVYNGTVSSLKRFKEDAKEVATGYECGIGIENFNDIKVEDIIETYETVETKREL